MPELWGKKSLFWVGLLTLASAFPCWYMVRPPCFPEPAKTWHKRNNKKVILNYYRNKEATCTLHPWKVNTANLAPLWNWRRVVIITEGAVKEALTIIFAGWKVGLHFTKNVTWYLLCATISVPNISAWPERSSTATLSVFPQSTLI